MNRRPGTRRRTTNIVGYSVPSSSEKPMAEQPIATTKRNIIKLVIILLAMLNVICICAIALFNAYTASIQTAKKNEHIKLVNNHTLYFRSLIEENSNLYNLHEAYLSAIIKNESSFRTDARSSVGALGLMQLMPDTAEWIAGKLKVKDFSFENLADPELNLKFGSWYLRFLSDKFNADPVLTTAAYHTGQGKVANWLADKSISKDGRTINVENLPDGPTKKYVERVLKAYEVYNALYFMQSN